jgi:MYXO-CTERM domain-containing protein
VIVPERGFDPDAGSKATVGGQPAPVTKTTLQDGGVSVGVGRVQVEISPRNQQGPAAPSAPGRATDLSVATGQSATVSGGGLLPGSVLQVWLPGVTGGVAKELARIPVKSDGSFASELTFTPQQTGAPVPIGRQLLQVTGFDERGDQTVVDMTIAIAQGAPAPEPNRATGALPGLLPGQSLATAAGLPENVVIEARPEVQQVAVISDGWSFTVGLPETSGSVEASEGGASIVFEQQQTATVSGDGFQPDTRVDIWLFSDPTLLGSVIVAADGSFSGEVYLDPNFAVVGEHTLQLQGVGMDGFIRAANLGVVVEGHEAQTSDTGNSVLWWIVGAFLLALLFLLLLLARRRRSQEQ